MRKQSSGRRAAGGYPLAVRRLFVENAKFDPGIVGISFCVLLKNLGIILK